MKKNQQTQRMIGLIGLAGTLGSMMPAATVFATPIQPSNLQEFWEAAGLEDVQEAVTQDMLQDAEKELMKLSDTISRNEIKRQSLTEAIKVKLGAIKETEKEVALREDLYSRRYEKATGQVMSLQVNKTGTVETIINVLFGTDNLGDMIGKLRVITQLNGANGQVMTELEDERLELVALKDSLMHEHSRLEVKQDQLTDLLEELAEQKAEAETLFDALQAEWDIQEEEKAKLKIEQERLLDSYQEEMQEQRALLLRIQAENLNTYKASETSLADLANRQTDPALSNQVVSSALNYLGVPYVWGGGTAKGFDCSGLTQFIYKDAGVDLPRVAADQSRQGTRVEMDALEPGDLLFWGPEGTSYHVGIYLGNGQFIHAPKPGDVVKITKLKHFMPDFAKRVLPKNSLNLMKYENVVSLSSSLTTRDARLVTGPTSLLEVVFNATYYSAFDGAQIGITAGGTNMAGGNIHTRDGYRIVAVDRNVIPLGTKMRVTTGDGQTFLAKADDTGGVIKGNKLDIAVSSPEEAFRLGRTTAVIEIIE